MRAFEDASGATDVMRITLANVPRAAGKKEPRNSSGVQLQAVFAGDGGEVLPGDGKDIVIGMTDFKHAQLAGSEQSSLTHSSTTMGPITGKGLFFTTTVWLVAS